MLNTNTIREIITPICKQYGIDRMYLFGSYARNEAREDSDVDLIVEFETRAVSLFTLAGLMNDLEEIFGVSVDIIHGPPGKDCMLEIDKEIEIYAA